MHKASYEKSKAKEWRLKNNNSIKENMEDCLRRCLSVNLQAPHQTVFNLKHRKEKCVCVCVCVCVCCGKSKRVHYHIRVVLWSLLRLPYFLNASIFIRLIYSRNCCFMKKKKNFYCIFKASNIQLLRKEKGRLSAVGNKLNKIMHLVLL